MVIWGFGFPWNKSDKRGMKSSLEASISLIWIYILFNFIDSNETLTLRFYLLINGWIRLFLWIILDGIGWWGLCVIDGSMKAPLCRFCSSRSWKNEWEKKQMRIPKIRNYGAFAQSNERTSFWNTHSSNQKDRPSVNLSGWSPLKRPPFWKPSPEPSSLWMESALVNLGPLERTWHCGLDFFWPNFRVNYHFYSIITHLNHP